MNDNKENLPIDFVIIWVDDRDINWRKKRNKYLNKQDGESKTVDASDERYRDWDMLKYWFRGVEKYAPWVRKIHFVSDDQLPLFLDTSHPKLNVVKHTDFIPEKYLPTFSANPIELNLHRIEGLSEKFIYFNDDMFLNSDVSEKDFFVDGKPCYECRETMIWTNNPEEMLSHIELNNVAVINRNFNKKNVYKKNLSNWINSKIGIKDIIRNIAMLFVSSSYFQNFSNNHLCTPLCKSIYEELWNKEYNILNLTSLNKFRSMADVNQYLLRDWAMVKGEFKPSRPIGQVYHLGDKTTLDAAQRDIINGISKVICINDTANVKDFDLNKRCIINAFEKKYPFKSSFEK